MSAKQDNFETDLHEPLLGSKDLQTTDKSAVIDNRWVPYVLLGCCMFAACNTALSDISS